jgi:Radical SAM superfamily
MPTLRVVILKPSKYALDGYVERFRWGFMPNSTLPYMASLTPARVGDCDVEVHAIDEYIQTDLSYLDLLKGDRNTLLALVGVQSHQLHRSLDLAAFAQTQGVRNCIIGGPHPMTCDTTMLQDRGVSFSLSEAEMVWDDILRDAVGGTLKPVYGGEARWKRDLRNVVVRPPPMSEFRRFIIPMLGLYPARGCPFTCNYCSVIKVAGRQIRSASIESIVESLRLAKQAGVQLVMFTSDNFNKYPDAKPLLEAMIDEHLDIPFMIQCDVQVSRQDDLLELLGRAGCYQMFVGVESFNRKTLLGARKAQNHPAGYADIVAKCREQRIMVHFSNMIGFPQDTRDSVEEHLGVLRDLDPDIASFYVLTPIPGTEQYGDFLHRGLLTEPNMDRYDTTYPTWQHPSFGTQELYDTLYSCYRRFYSVGHAARFLRRNGRQKSVYLSALGLLYPLFNHYSTFIRCHPMSGGVTRRWVDSAADYKALRRSRYDIELAPLPECLELSPADAQLNARAKLLVSA